MCKPDLKSLTTKDGQIFKLGLEVIELTENQFQFLVQKIAAKDVAHWKSSEGYVDITLTQDQMETVMYVKDTIFKHFAPNNDMDKLLQSGKFGFSSHATTRIGERILKDLKESAIQNNKLRSSLNMDLINEEAYSRANSDEVLVDVLNLLSVSGSLHPQARWKAGQKLSYKFNTNYSNYIISIVVTFDETSFIITVITN